MTEWKQQLASLLADPLPGKIPLPYEVDNRDMAVLGLMLKHRMELAAILCPPSQEAIDEATYQAGRRRDLHPNEVPGIIDQALEAARYLDSLNVPHDRLAIRIREAMKRKYKVRP